jgi:MFS family permease
MAESTGDSPTTPGGVDPRADTSSPIRRRSRRGLFGLLAANLVSILGTRMSTLALPWFVLTTTGSAGETGLVVFAEMAPYVLLQAFGGPLVDRLGNWRMSVASDLAAGLTLALVPVAYVAGSLSLPMLIALVAVTGAVRGAGDTARHVLVPGLTEAAGTSLERASGWYDGVNRAASMIGAPLAGVLVAVTSAPAVVAIDAATFGLSALLIAAFVPRSAAARLEGSGRPVAGEDAAGLAEADAPAGDPGYVASLREGFSHLATDRLLVGIALLVLVTNLLDQAFFSVLAPVWAIDVTGSPVVLGLMGATMGAGALAGNGVVAWLADRLPRRLTFAWGFLVAGGPRFFILAVASSVSPVLAVCFVSGFGAGGINPVLSAVEFERVPARLQARVLGALGATAWAGIPFGALAGGALVDHLGLQGALMAAGGAYLVTTLAPFVFPVWREMDRRPGATLPEIAIDGAPVEAAAAQA